MKHLTKEIIPTVLRAILGLVFCVSAILKLVSVNDFEIYITSLEFFSFDLSSLFARLLIVGELLLGIALISSWWRNFIDAVTAVMLVAFSAFLIWRISLGDEESCHCFGSLIQMNPLQSLIKNIVALSVLFLVHKYPGIQFLGFWKYKKLTALASCLIIGVSIFVINPPDFYFRLINHLSSDLNSEELHKYSEDTPLDDGRRIVFFYSPDCPHCCHCAAKMDAIISYHKIPRERCFAFFMQTSLEMDDVIAEFWSRCGKAKFFDYKYINPYLFIPITNGSIPLVATFEDGKLIKEYDVFSIDELEIADFILRP